VSQLGTIRTIQDPVRRARAAQDFIEQVRQQTTTAQTIRDEAIRVAHRTGAGTRAEIADQVGVTVHTVITALREK
jgi:bacterioferritin-associated ferredoxin